ncbi:MAG TPA: tRNA epoxyqueuosine(34) reductase QueG [Ignavibacteriaceae bacterium]|nr:tRNA epoxyqueuosine(34) reductase QueG [Ignavibacteriaceae bacterium]
MSEKITTMLQDRITNESVIRKAKSLGFSLVGFAKVELLSSEISNLNQWLESNYQAGMIYMQKNSDKREDISKILLDAKTVISLGMNYYTNHQHSNKRGMGKVSRYAWGKDYHLVIWEKLNEIENYLHQIDSKFESKSYVDTGPVMDKAWAVRSGIGWMGKHSNIINRDFGSWFFIANIICNQEFDYSEPIPDFCGECTACIDACPTDAIIQNYIVDANKCISYLTIENKGSIDTSFKNKFENWLFGCDICQDVCPWNIKFAQETALKEFQPEDGNKEIELKSIKEMSDEDFKKKFSDSPISRAKLKGLKRNAEFLINPSEFK